eukprot:TRINITY_DN9137_c1_g1_i1.p2 TRINITY_DN9137_c1_g1~~TRINITY_DN9137_c1_g1_i1.p2  ORF type:complete len:128 (-),score=22.35 TRINITY_DN9137_c1_g1_i1:65-448(-)
MDRLENYTKLTQGAQLQGRLWGAPCSTSTEGTVDVGASVGAARTACPMAPVGGEPPAGVAGSRGATPRCSTAADPTGDVTAGGETPAASSAAGRKAAAITAALVVHAFSSTLVSGRKDRHVSNEAEK